MAVASASGKWRFGLMTDAAQLRSSRGRVPRTRVRQEGRAGQRLGLLARLSLVVFRKASPQKPQFVSFVQWIS
jgi:hypothetical protein